MSARINTFVIWSAKRKKSCRPTLAINERGVYKTRGGRRVIIDRINGMAGAGPIQGTQKWHIWHRTGLCITGPASLDILHFYAPEPPTEATHA